MTAHLAHQTSFTRTGKVDMQNRKPFRNAAQKALARQTARKCDDGTWRSSAPVSYHRSAKQNRDN